MYGVLVAGDRQSPAGPPGDWRLFRTFTAENFRGWGASHVWRFFWFFNLVLLLFTLLFSAFILLAGLVALAGQAWGGVAALGVGCGGVLPLFFLLLLMSLWVGVAQADLANNDSSVRTASRRARRVLGKRLGGLLLIMLLGMVASVVLSMVFLPLSLGIDLAFRDAMIGGLVLKGVMYVVQWGVSGAIQVALAGSLVALVLDECRGGPLISRRRVRHRGWRRRCYRAPPALARCRRPARFPRCRPSLSAGAACRRRADASAALAAGARAAPGSAKLPAPAPVVRPGVTVVSPSASASAWPPTWRRSCCLLRLRGHRRTGAARVPVIAASRRAAFRGRRARGVPPPGRRASGRGPGEGSGGGCSARPEKPPTRCSTRAPIFTARIGVTRHTTRRRPRSSTADPGRRRGMGGERGLGRRQGRPR